MAMLATMNGAIGNSKGSNKKDRRAPGQNHDHFNVTNAGGHFNFNNHSMGPGTKMNPKAITKNNFYTVGF